MARSQAFDAVGQPERPAFRLGVVWPAREHSRGWLSLYATRLVWSDALFVLVAVLLAQQIRFGSDSTLQPNGASAIPAGIVSVTLVVTWMLSLKVFQAFDRRILGAGSVEYSRVVTSSFAVFGVLAILDLLFNLNIARGFLAIALPLGTSALLASRWLWRRHLAHQRTRSKNLEHILVIGGRRSAVPLMDRLMINPKLGYHVVGVCVPMKEGRRGEMSVGEAKVPIWGSFADVREAVQKSGATTVAVTSAEALGHTAMQELAWDLQGLDVDMVVSPGILDVAGPRMMVRPVSGLPLLHIDKPSYEGANRFRKAAFDLTGSIFILLALLPALSLIAVAIKLDSSGPVFYRADRVGVGNGRFRMWKFRSMVKDADALKADLRNLDEGAGALFKIRDDPRVTRVGNFIRRYSLDELPQLLNVVTGDMSLVGPRPPLPEEVEKYDGRVARRMLVKPGMTGLWQVSGRSDLSWEESVRLDLSYVENWSMMQDFVILWRTFRAVVAKEGAY
ncbi:sugar transferase [Gordonia sp. zg691]|uniref:Sugar transferase n=1 Tax=Gordonia jinghuaiqii TaxID=2758710 RepID=A0A7D7LRW3_9ACTN|nr:sugar transferase [Gordonia jinghuaiqii]MBD0863092.1 sugar transferase [Gordonia jinghuaiqii]MCR5980396.1 exopolysaccharide biosynthesis polyprenyl glycosylphosphotransferase [Gordonia jinghuaiqii]QMT01865.1 sugar transferase [Gordonia jinghuaiqii]